MYFFVFQGKLKYSSIWVSLDNLQCLFKLIFWGLELNSLALGKEINNKYPNIGKIFSVFLIFDLFCKCSCNFEIRITLKFGGVYELKQFFGELIFFIDTFASFDYRFENICEILNDSSVFEQSNQRLM